VSAGYSVWRSYARIAASLRERIAAGNPPPGSLLPSESALCQDYGVTRNTVRRALAELAEDGLIETVPGRGRVVRSPNEPGSAAEHALPRYGRIAADLRAAIERGELAPGDVLPSEAALMKRHGVSRGTVRQALADLETAGLIESRPGKGRFVPISEPPDGR